MWGSGEVRHASTALDLPLETKGVIQNLYYSNLGVEITGRLVA
jgi:hypothetical protein